MKYHQPIIIFLILLLVCTLPVMGVTTYRDGSPKMTAVISGTNEFSPGQDASIAIVVQNSGVSTVKNYWSGYSGVSAEPTQPDRSRTYYEGQGSGTIERDDVPTTAKMVMVGLSAGTAPIVIRTDPQIIGDIATQGKVTVTLNAKITDNANEGEYQLPLTISYTYLAASDQPASDTLQSTYLRVNETIPITIRIKPQVQAGAIEAVPENLSVGTGGYITLKIKNTGFEDGRKATVKLLRNGNSPIIPTDSSIFIGDFPRNSVVTCRYKVAVSTEAEKQIYPVDVVVTYENREGEVVTSAQDTVGVPVGGKISFVAVPEVAEVIRGSDQVLVIKYVNTGDFTAYSAQARLSVVDPFASTDNTAYLGDIKPNESATARYKVSALQDAAVREYALDTEVRYRDSLDNSQISDTFKVPVLVQAEPASGSVIQILPVVGITLLVVLAAGYYLLVMRKKK